MTIQTVFQLEEIPACLPKDAKIEKILRSIHRILCPDIVSRKMITRMSKRIIVDENNDKKNIRLIRPKAKK